MEEGGGRERSGTIRTALLGVQASVGRFNSSLECTEFLYISKWDSELISAACVRLSCNTFLLLTLRVIPETGGVRARREGKWRGTKKESRNEQ